MDTKTKNKKSKDKIFNKIILIISIIILLIFSVDRYKIHKLNSKIEEYKKNNKAMITWIDDDGLSSFYTKLYPLALKHKIPMATAIIAKRNHDGKKYYSIEQAKEMQKNGIEIISHGSLHDSNHRPYQMSDEELAEDYRYSHEFQKKNGFEENIHAYPFGETGNRVLNNAKKYFDIAFVTKNRIVERPFYKYKIPRVQGQEVDLKEIYSKIDEISKSSGWIVLITHVDQGVPFSKEYYEGIINYAKEKGVEFVSIKDGYNRYKIFEEDNYFKIKRIINEKISGLINKIVK